MDRLRAICVLDTILYPGRRREQREVVVVRKLIVQPVHKIVPEVVENRSNEIVLAFR